MRRANLNARPFLLLPKEVNQQIVKKLHFEVDGVKTELKAVSNIIKTDADGLSAKLSQRIGEAGDQASRVISDVTNQPGMTKDIAERSINRAFGKQRRLAGDKLQEVGVIGKDFDVTLLYTQ